MTITTALEKTLDRLMKGHDRREDLVFGYPGAGNEQLKRVFLETMDNECFRKRLEVVHYYIMNNTIIASIYVK